MQTSTNSTVILARVSSKAQEDEGYSLDSQLKLLHEYCERRDLQVEKVFRIAETASKDQSRKVFSELLKYISKHKINNLAVEKTDRLTRNLRDAVAVDDWLNKDPMRKLHAVKESLVVHKEATSDVKFMWNIHLAVAKKYTDNLREEAMKGWAEKLAQGWMPAPPPPGYKKAMKDGKSIHVVDRQTALKIQKAFELYLEPDQSIKTVTVFVAKAGVTSRRGKPLSESYVHKMLANPFYVGTIKFNGETYPGAQEPIIERDLFDAVQAKLTRKNVTRYRKHDIVLKGVVKCEHCDGVVSWQKQKGRYYGNCQRKKPKCKTRKYIREDLVLGKIEKQLSTLINPSAEVMSIVYESINLHWSKDGNQPELELDGLQKQVDRLKDMDERLYDDKLAGEISIERYKAKHAEFTAKIADLEAQMKPQSNEEELAKKRAISIVKLTQNAAQEYAKIQTVQSKRKLIIELFDTLQLGSDSISVNFNKFVTFTNQKMGESMQIAQTAKTNNRTFSRGENNRCKNKKIDLNTEIYPLWQG